jgi:hypothetical protein
VVVENWGSGEAEERPDDLEPQFWRYQFSSHPDDLLARRHVKQLSESKVAEKNSKENKVSGGHQKPCQHHCNVQRAVKSLNSAENLREAGLVSWKMTRV